MDSMLKQLFIKAIHCGNNQERLKPAAPEHFVAGRRLCRSTKDFPGAYRWVRQHFGVNLPYSEFLAFVCCMP